MTQLAERLRHETRPHHEQTEQLFYTEDLKNGTLTLDAYKHLLRTHLTFHQALETAIDGFPLFFQDYAPETRRKSAWLRQDLAALDEPVHPVKSDLFLGWSPIKLLGATYVGEGSMLGGSVIWRLLQKNQAIQPNLPRTRFYQGYGPDTGLYWKQFGAFLAREGEAHPDDVVQAAQQTFDQYQAIFLQAQLPAEIR